MARTSQPNYSGAFLAGVLAWVIPGAGHLYLRRTLRGIVLFISINALFWSGMVIGGVFTVEPLRQRWWFVAQMCAGASGGVSWYLQDRHRKAIAAAAGLPPRPERSESPRQWWKSYTRELAKRKLALVFPTDQVARAYTGIAGMLNLLCIFDAVMLGLIGKFGEPPPPRAPRAEAET